MCFFFIEKFDFLIIDFFIHELFLNLLRDFFTQSEYNLIKTAFLRDKKIYIYTFLVSTYIIFIVLDISKKK